MIVSLYLLVGVYVELDVVLCTNQLRGPVDIVRGGVHVIILSECCNGVSRRAAM